MSRFLVRQLAVLITQGKAVVQTVSSRDQEYVDRDAVAKWRVQCRALVTALGNSGRPWANSFEDGDSRRYTVQQDLAHLEGLSEAIDLGLMVRVEDLVYADAFADLLEQADELLDKDYILAAAVVLRAVLEERLKLLCDRNACGPAKDRPTISDYRVALVQAQVIDRITAANVEAMTATGNHAAHNKPDLRRDDVIRLRRDLGDLLVRFST